MDYQDLLEQSYVRLTTKEHRKDFAQFFTPPAIASLMAAYILDNLECQEVLDPAAGMSVFARALDEQLMLRNHQPFDLSYQSLLASHVVDSTSNARLKLSFAHFSQISKAQSNLSLLSMHSMLAFNSLEAQQLYEHLTNPSITPRIKELKFDTSYQLHLDYKSFDMEVGERSLLPHLSLTSPDSTIPSIHSHESNFHLDCDHAASASFKQSLLLPNLEDEDEEIGNTIKAKASACLSTNVNRTPRTINLRGYELDHVIAEFNELSFMQSPLSYVNYALTQRDYLKSSFKEQYDGIICNPPYLTFKDFAKQKGALSVIEKHLNINLAGRINLYALFLLKSLSQLKPNGRCAYLIPYEFLNSSFGIQVKEHFLAQQSLAYVITFNTKNPLFDNVTTTCGLFLFDRSKRHEGVEFIPIQSLSELDELTLRLCPHLAQCFNYPVEPAESTHSSDSKLDESLRLSPMLLATLPLERLHTDPNNEISKWYQDLDRSQSDSQIQGRVVPYSELNAKQKWHIYYQDRNLKRKLKDHQVGSSGVALLSTFDRFIKVKRGIATGANNFFLFDHHKMDQYQLDPKYFVPVIPRANLVPRPIFTRADHNRLAQEGASVYLLNAPSEIDDPKLRQYLALGEQQELHRRYLTRHRSPWYSLERREVAPILMSVFNRGNINVVRNEAEIFNLTTFHSIFVLDPRKTDIIFAYMLTPLAKDIILQNRREYGGGLEKLEPLDINHSACVNFDALSSGDEEQILKIYKQYRDLVLKGHTNGELSELIAKISQAFSVLLHPKA